MNTIRKVQRLELLYSLTKVCRMFSITLGIDNESSEADLDVGNI